ncbi:barstar family protein [Rhodocyclus tenuis]|uniref:Barstar family protein n=1 Tax=Rhodocyclus gracilis TaxID=2929842 RepID=A0ABX0WH98_9RHOO|nr:barstar family protein [Rhodocyclus gracilis]NJA88192.1 barstar family protein [Rhodocyclus gracilis]
MSELPYFRAALARPGIAGLRRLPAAEWPTLAAAAEALGLACVTVDLSDCDDATAALRELGKALAFPDWYGANFDALSDCLGDFADEPARGAVLLLHGDTRLRTGDADGAATLLEVFAAVAEARQNSLAPLWIFVPAGDLPDFP